jgi:hypothetical protein
MSLIAFALAAVLAAAGSLQDEDTARNCRDDNGVDRCARVAEDALSLGMPSLETEKAAGAEVYRILQIDGYGRLMPAVAYERRVGAGPQVVVYAKDGVRMAAAVPLVEWEAVQGMARFADREMTPPPGQSNPDEINICFHAWLSTVEIANAADRGRPDGSVRRRTESACNGGLASRFAFDLAALAIKRFPDCDVLNPDDYRNDMTRLEQCARFSGDRLAVAQLVNQVERSFMPEREDGSSMGWARRLQPRESSRLDWDGQVMAGGGGARSPIAVFMARMQAENPSLRLYPSRFEGVSSTRVEVAGDVSMENPQDENGPPLSASFRQTWVWDVYGLTWALESWAVEPFAPLRRN